MSLQDPPNADADSSSVDPHSHTEMTYIARGLFDDRDAAARAVHGLKSQKFTKEEISIVAKPDEADLSAQAHATAQRDVHTGVWAGTALGAAAGGCLAIVSWGLIPALPLLLVGGAVIGGLAGSMSALGVAGGDVHETEAILRAGGALVVVHEPTEERAKQAVHVLEEAGARFAAIAQEGSEHRRLIRQGF